MSSELGTVIELLESINFMVNDFKIMIPSLLDGTLGPGHPATVE
jgi:hypothetical protein